MTNFTKYTCIILLILQIYVRLTVQDIFMSNPRGSNNRLNEKSQNRANNNRLFNSQNNNRGGYNVGDIGNGPAGNDENKQYQMKYFQSGSKGGDSVLTLEWTHQHGCGGKEDANCNVVIQYMCDDRTDPKDRLRDGVATASQGYTQMGSATTKAEHLARKEKDVKSNRGLHETWEYYERCRYRQRNYNLFMADRGTAKTEKGYSGAIHTRQQNNGARSGYECAEERDYYPYWHPNPWKDIAILTSDEAMCEKLYNKNSFNVKPLSECTEFYEDGTSKHWSKHNNKADCENNNGYWTEFYNYLEKAPQFNDEASCEKQSKPNLVYKWAVPYGAENVRAKECLVLLNAPVCEKAAYTRRNHLGNTADGYATNYTWTLPYFPSNTAQNCIVRIRYNISTDDYDGFEADYKLNQNYNPKARQESPVRNNPKIDLGMDTKVRLAINTAQFGRTFQDRSHSFYLVPRGNDIPHDAKLYNLNVRGRRGNIVQVYPAVEYDFIPNYLTINKNDLIHLQWTGSNTSPDGAGQGQANTDRSNFLQISEMNVNYPMPFEPLSSFWSDVQALGVFDGSKITNRNKSTYLRKNALGSKDLALNFGTSGYYQCFEATNCAQDSVQTKGKASKLDQELNKASASFPGAILRFTQADKEYFYMSSRNNAFSNRAQKGVIMVKA